jgi:hypothetical protein
LLRGATEQEEVFLAGLGRHLDRCAGYVSGPQFPPVTAMQQPVR